MLERCLCICMRFCGFDWMRLTCVLFFFFYLIRLALVFFLKELVVLLLSLEEAVRSLRIEMTA